jgi:hypothetical protein
MQENRDPAFAAWVAAESAAYTAIHSLHQFTCGGRKQASAAQIEKIAMLREEAAALFAELQGKFVAPTSTVVHIGTKRPAKEPVRPIMVAARAVQRLSSQAPAA